MIVESLFRFSFLCDEIEILGLGRAQYKQYICRENIVGIYESLTRSLARSFVCTLIHSYIFLFGGLRDYVDVVV